MRIKKIQGGAYVLSFSLFGVELTREFDSFSDAYSFQENMKKSFAISSAPMSMAVEKYKREISIKKSEQSCLLDAYILEHLLSYLETHSVFLDSPTGLVTYTMLESYQNHLLERGYSPASVNRHFSTIKNFFKCCEKWEFVSKNPSAFVSSLNTTSSGKIVWEDYTHQFVRERLNRNDANLLEFLRLTGARLSSAVRLKIKDIDLNKNELGLSSRKGPRAKEKIYTFPIYHALKKFLTPIVFKKTYNDFAFLRPDGKPYVAKDYAKRVNKILRRSPQAANNDAKGLSLHGLRHSFASQMHQKGMTLNEVKSLLGHATIRTTEGYLHSERNQVLEKINKTW